MTFVFDALVVALFLTLTWCLGYATTAALHRACIFFSRKDTPTT